MILPAPYEWTLDLNQEHAWFCAVVGLDDRSEEAAEVCFKVFVDGRQAAGTGTISRGSKPALFRVDLKGADRLTLLVQDRSVIQARAWSAWAGAWILAGSEDASLPNPVPAPKEIIPSIMHPEDLSPRIHHPVLVGGSPGKPFLFRLPVTGRSPMRVTAKGLPKGIGIERDKGILAGVPKEAGRYSVQVIARNAHGRARSLLTLRLEPGCLALTPPMGWNSWNIHGCTVDQEKVSRSARALVELGLASRGYQYVNIDDCWMGERDERGRLVPNERFPDLPGLADTLHGMGLKLGIYSSPGPFTCQGYPGSYLNERQDAMTWSQWGVDYLKYDWCSYQDLFPRFQREQLMEPYLRMREALDACERDIVFSLCQYGLGSVWEWGRDVGGNLWRTTADITDTWSSVEGIGFSQNGKETWAGPGHWNDPDMLAVGKVGWGRGRWDSRLTWNEQMTHMTLWCLLAAPLLVGCDLEEMDAFTLALLTHEEVLAVNQDPLGQQASRRKREGFQEIWARPLWDDTWAVGLFNRGWLPAQITLDWELMEWTGSLPVRDLWPRKDLGRFDRSLTLTVPRHGAILLKVGESRGPFSPIL